MIERARAKRALEASLPPPEDTARLPERLRLMEEQETLEWKQREDEIAKLQEERFQLTKQAPQAREDQRVQKMEEAKGSDSEMVLKTTVWGLSLWPWR
eukprot:m.245265 g.245265  ORF g.245265 m.245265 type:complete len:98 (-) comp22571_c0_seq4:234-527(-)